MLTIINTSLPASALLALRPEALDLSDAGPFGPGRPKRNPGPAILRTGGLIYVLHRHTAAALAKLPASPRERLFAWPGSAKRPTEMCLWYLRKLCARASIPLQKHAAFERLRATVEQLGTAALERLDCERIERERQALGEQREAAVRSKREETRPSSHQAAVPGFYRRPKQTREVYIIANAGPRSLHTFLHQEYAPLKLAPLGGKSVVQYESALSTLAGYRGAEVTLDQLSADFVEGAMAWLVRSGRSASTANRVRASVLALWRYAMRKKFVPWSGEPEMVEKLKLPKREPRTWTLEQFERILGPASP